MTVVKPMLAKDAPADLSALTYPLIVQPKLDGIRCLIVNGQPVSRTHKAIPNNEIRRALSLARLNGLDGELIVGDPTHPNAYQRTVSFVMAADKTGEPWAFHVFDLWSHDGTYDARRTLIPLVAGGHPRIESVGVFDYFALDESGVDKAESALIERGYEGAILRDPKARYKHGRSGVKGPLLKLKRFIDFEAEVIGVYEEQHNGNEATKDAFGRTERSSHKANKTGKGRLGGLELRAINGPCAGVEFRCGTGFDHETRERLWARATVFDDLGAPRTGLNREVVKIKSFPVVVKDKPRHPVFLGFRDMEVDG